MNRDQKEQVVAELSALLHDSKAVILSDFKGLRVEEMRGLRSKIRQAGGNYRVVKNTLLRIVAQGTGLEKARDLMVGNNGVGSTNGDPVTLAKAMVEFAKEKDKFVVKGGVLGGRPVNFEQIKAIATLPSREVLLASVLGTMNAVPTGFVRVLNAIPNKLVYALAAIRDQKEQSAA